MRGKYLPSSTSLRLAEEIAQSLGLDFDEAVAAKDAPGLLGAHYREVKGVLGPSFDHVLYQDFSAKLLQARAGISTHGRPHIHVDQHMDFWTFGLCLLWSHAAINGIAPDEEALFDKTFLDLLDQRGGGTEHADTLAATEHFLRRSGPALRVAYDLSVACFVFMVCHELAHYTLCHHRKPASPALEMEADMEGQRLLMQVFEDPAALKLIPWQPYSICAGWASVRLLDAAERRQAQRGGLSAPAPSETHPLSAVRAAALLSALTATGLSKEARNFRQGYDAVLDQILGAVGLETVFENG